MKILIIENELYLSHSISEALMALGHFCTMCVGLDKNIMNHKYDVVLLSTSINGVSVSSIKQVHQDSIVILLASYVNNETTSDVLHNGAIDYILKPFMINELIDKIEHYISYENLKVQCSSYEKYFENMFIGADFDINNIERELPMLALKYNRSFFDDDHILEIKEYVEYIIRTYQHKLSDTELSKKLGISRKSVWEKRKRYAIERE